MLLVFQGVNRRIKNVILLSTAAWYRNILCSYSYFCACLPTTNTLEWVFISESWKFWNVQNLYHESLPYSIQNGLFFIFLATGSSSWPLVNTISKTCTTFLIHYPYAEWQLVLDVLVHKENAKKVKAWTAKVYVKNVSMSLKFFALEKIHNK